MVGSGNEQGGPPPLWTTIPPHITIPPPLACTEDDGFSPDLLNILSFHENQCPSMSEIFANDDMEEHNRDALLGDKNQCSGFFISSELSRSDFLNSPSHQEPIRVQQQQAQPQVSTSFTQVVAATSSSSKQVFPPTMSAMPECLKQGLKYSPLNIDKSPGDSYNWAKYGEMQVVAATSSSSEQVFPPTMSAMPECLKQGLQYSPLNVDKRLGDSYYWTKYGEMQVVAATSSSSKQVFPPTMSVMPEYLKQGLQYSPLNVDKRLGNSYNSTKYGEKQVVAATSSSSKQVFPPTMSAMPECLKQGLQYSPLDIDKLPDDSYNWTKYGEKQVVRATSSSSKQVFPPTMSAMPKCFKQGLQWSHLNVDKRLGDSYNWKKYGEKQVVAATSSSSKQVFPPTMSAMPECLKQGLQYSPLNVDKLPSDSYNWTKYGEKKMKGFEFTQSSYMCTQQDFLAKKNVEHSLASNVPQTTYKYKHNHQPLHASKVTNVIVTTSTNSNVQEKSVRKEVGGHESQVVEKKDEPNPKRRNIEVSYLDPTSSCYKVSEPRLIVQEISDVDILYDGYKWQKYGQKNIKGNPNPRSYYKCTTQGCNVRKHVGRDPTNPRVVLTKYEGKHNHDVPRVR